MTLGDLMNWGGFGKAPAAPSIERYHSGPTGYWDHKSHGHGSHKSGGKGGGHGAALSALTLLAFLFLINVMQQSLQENNSTTAAAPMTGATALLLRDGQQQVSPSARAGADGTKASRQREDSGTSDKRLKGDVLDFEDHERS